MFFFCFPQRSGGAVIVIGFLPSVMLAQTPIDAEDLVSRQLLVGLTWKYLHNSKPQSLSKANKALASGLCLPHNVYRRLVLHYYIRLTE